MLPIEDAVIVVEDDSTLRSLMADILAEVGAKPMAFETAGDPLTHLLEIHGDYPLMIVDQSLPGQIQGMSLLSWSGVDGPRSPQFSRPPICSIPLRSLPRLFTRISRGHWTTWLPL